MSEVSVLSEGEFAEFFCREWQVVKVEQTKSGDWYTMRLVASDGYEIFPSTKWSGYAASDIEAGNKAQSNFESVYQLCNPYFVWCAVNHYQSRNPDLAQRLRLYLPADYKPF